MAIDKMIPRFLVSDEDERLLKEGTMTDALNVTISEDGDGSEGVLKNVKGTTAATAVSGSELTDGDAVTVIGQVSDPQRGFIYFFVADDSGDSEHAIYQYNTKSVENNGLAANKYRKVFKNSWLDFQPGGFVKADVLNGAFQQDGVTQTILYFTDNYNQPRKINVDRAISGDYDSIPSSALDYSLNTVKSTNTSPPLFFFDSDSSVTSNNFKDKTFQFASQFIYKDGEESAISSYSELAFPSFLALYGSEESPFDSLKENVCLIDLNVSDSPRFSDVKRIRIIGRQGNDGAPFIIDEVDRQSDKQAEVFGQSITVYSSSEGIYRFYNDGVYASVDPQLVNKSYDNVPLKARGQSLVGNRLLYSNYSEGRDNVDVQATITVTYQNPLSESAESEVTVVELPVEASDLSDGNLTIDFGNIPWPQNSSNQDFVPSNTMIALQFTYNPEGTVYSEENGGMVSLNIERTGPAGIFEADQTIYLGYKEGANQADLVITNQNPITVSRNYKTESSMTVFQLAEQFSILFSEATFDYPKNCTVADYTTDFYVTEDDNFKTPFSSGLDPVYVTQDEIWVNNNQGSYTSVDGASQTSTFHISNFDYDLNYRFDDVSWSIPNTYITIKPYIKSVSVNSIELDAFLTFTYNGILFDTAAFEDYVNDGQGQTLNVSNQLDTNPTITNTSAYLVSSDTYTSISQSISSFKSGSSHPLGIVYYDEFGRHGFVNEIGSAYVKALHERTAAYAGSEISKGPAEITVGFQSEPPDWAHSWQLVYGGPTTYDSFLVTAVAMGEETDSSYSSTSKKIYVSLKPLELFAENSSPNRQYSYTEGDKLRVLFNTDSNDNLVYKNSNQPGSMEFDVVGVVRDPASATENGPVDSSSAEAQLHSGDWLVLSHPSINAGALVDDNDSNGSLDNLKYEGYDFFSISNTLYPNGDASSNTNLWENGTIVEIYSPKKTVSNEVYYEIGERHSAKNGPKGSDPWNTSHGPAIKTMNGSVWWRPVTFTLPEDHNNAGHLALSDYPQKTYYIECETPSELINKKEWHKGRPHVSYKNAATIRRFNGVTYSDAYAEDVANLSLSSFNPSLGNFDSLESKFGAINYIGNYNDNLVALQENKLSLIPVGKNIIQYAEGSGNVAISTNVLGQARYSSGDYGCGGHPEAVLIQDNDVFFVDESRQAVMRLGGEQLAPISEKNMSSFFEDFFKAGHAKYVSGYDPRISTYFITGHGGSGDGYSAETVGYDVARGVWQSKYSFTPDVYANQNNMLYSAKYTSGNDIFWMHDSTTRNNFYDANYPSEVEMVSKLSPSRVKVYNAISYEGDSSAWTMSTAATTDLGQTSGTITSWSEREGSYYASMPRNTSSNSTSQKIYVGNSVEISDLTTLTLSGVRLSRVQIPIGATIQYENDTGNLVNFGVEAAELTVSSVDSNTQITLSDISLINVFGKKVFVVLDSATNGDVMRGHYAKIKLTNNSNAKHELYCINAHITDSKSHHSLEQ